MSAIQPTRDRGSLPITAGARLRRVLIIAIVVVAASGLLWAGSGAVGMGGDRLAPVVRGLSLSASTTGRGMAVFVTAGATDASGVGTVEIRVDGGEWSPMAALGGFGGPSMSLAALVNAPVRSIAIGSAHACALMEAGTVRCLGAGWAGQLGNDAMLDSAVPVSVFGLSSVTSIAAGRSHTCAVLAVGSVACWGSGAAGELGDGRRLSSAVPVAVTGLSGVRAIAAGGSRTCALGAGGTVACWGDVVGAASGQGPFRVAAPIAVPGLSGVTAIAMGTQHACALLATGGVSCWGGNLFGQLGDGSVDSTAHPDPSPVIGLVAARAIAGGDSHTCAALRDGTVSCWGATARGELGQGLIASQPQPLPAGVLDGGGPLANVTALAAGARHTCGLLGDGTVRCWGANDAGQLGTAAPGEVLPGVRDASGLAAGGDHACAVLDGGWVRCWGAAGHVGQGTPGARDPDAVALAPATLAGLLGALAEGRHTICARAADLAGNMSQPACVLLDVVASAGPSPNGSGLPLASPSPTPSPTPLPTASGIPIATSSPSPSSRPSVAPSATARPDGRIPVGLIQALVVNGVTSTGPTVLAKPGASITSTVKSAPALKGLTVELWRQAPGGAWTKVATAALDATGAAKYAWPATRPDATYRWRFNGTAKYAPADSPMIRLLVSATASPLP